VGYRIEGYTQTSEVQGGTKIVKVREYHVFSLPSETYFQFRRPKPQAGVTTGPYAASSIKAVAKQLSDRIEAVLAIATVTDVVYSQDVTPGGQLQDTITTFYEADNGNIQGSVEQPMANFGPTVTAKLVAAEIAAGGDFLT
jgi:hypothetical protein